MFLGAAAAAVLMAACANGSPDPAVVSMRKAPAPVGFVDDAITDAGLPSATPSEPTGALGFDRYVWVAGDDGGVVPVVVEGPRAGAIRCQDPADTCSYLELKALHESGDPIPDHLSMTADDLATLVGQLDQTAATVDALSDIDDACAAGYVPVSAANPNMGVHLTKPALIGDGFDPAAPEMLLFASADAIGLTRNELGGCEGGKWTGVEGLQAVGAAFFVDFSDEHPAGFAGDIDNWHMHYNSCAGAQLDNLGSSSLCESEGGAFFEQQPNWMIHAYVAPALDNQAGVFAMWNDRVWPIGGSEQRTHGPHDHEPHEAETVTTIDDFAFESVQMAAGGTVVFDNADRVPHVVAAGTPQAPRSTFDSGIVVGGSSFSVTLEKPGEYSYFCTLHPSMQATITVI